MAKKYIDNKKKYTLRLYKTHDLDLITLIELYEYDIVKAVYCSLTAFSHGDVFVIKTPAKRQTKMGILKKVYSRQLRLDREKDGDAISILEMIAPGYRNNFLKNLLRQYICNPVTELFLLDNTDAQFFYNRFDIFKNDRRRADAAQLAIRKKTYKKEQVPNSNDKDTIEMEQVPLEVNAGEKKEVNSDYLKNNKEKTGENSSESFVQEPYILKDASDDDVDLTDVFASLIE
jgi:hypothetical protein